MNPDLIAIAGALAAIVASVVAGLRARAPKLDGWPVLAVSAVLSGLISLGMHEGPWRELVTLSVVTFALASGGPALLGAIASKAAPKPVEMTSSTIATADMGRAVTETVVTTHPMPDQKP